MTAVSLEMSDEPKIYLLLLILNVVLMNGCKEQAPKQSSKQQVHQERTVKSEVDLIKKYGSLFKTSKIDMKRFLFISSLLIGLLTFGSSGIWSDKVSLLHIKVTQRGGEHGGESIKNNITEVPKTQRATEM